MVGRLAQPGWLPYPHMRVATCECLYKDSPSLPAFPLLHPKPDLVGRVDSPSQKAGPSGLPKVTPIEQRALAAKKSHPPPICRMSVEAPPTCLPTSRPHRVAWYQGDGQGRHLDLGPTHSSLTPPRPGHSDFWTQCAPQQPLRR